MYLVSIRYILDLMLESIKGNAEDIYLIIIFIIIIVYKILGLIKKNRFL